MKREFVSFASFLTEGLASPLTSMSVEHMKTVLKPHWGEHVKHIQSVHFHKLHHGTDAHYHVISHDEDEGTYMVHSVHLSHHQTHGIRADHVGAMPDSEHHSYQEAKHEVETQTSCCEDVRQQAVTLARKAGATRDPVRKAALKAAAETQKRAAQHMQTAVIEGVVTQTPKFKQGDVVHVRLNDYTIAHGSVERVGEFGYHVKFSEAKPASHYTPEQVHASYEDAAKQIKRVKLKVPDEKVAGKK